MKKIGEIKGVPVVEGDANLVKNQILYKETDNGISLSKRTNGKLEEVSGSDNSSSGGGGKVEYWGISDKYNHGAKYEEDLASAALYMMINISGGYFKGINDSSEKVEIVNAFVPANHYESNKTLYFKALKAFTFSPTFIEHEKANTFNDILSLSNAQGIDLNDLVYPITEEEFYNLD